MRPFEIAPEFISDDNRVRRTRNPVTAEQMHNKHEALLPKEYVQDRRILDLGCGIGASGHWALSFGAAHYVGVEMQKSYADTARKLLNKYHPEKATIYNESLDTWLTHRAEHFDVVLLLASLHFFTDYYTILKSVCARTDILLVEELRPDPRLFHPETAGVQFLENQTLNLADEDASAIGRGVKITPSGLTFILKDFGFSSAEMLVPRPITMSRDVYAPGSERYLMRFYKTASRATSLGSSTEDLTSHPRKPW